MKKHIVSFSGGKDSTAMLLKMIEKGMHIDEIVFCDTGIEFPEMYEHIEQVKKFINRDITVLKADKDFEYYMLTHKKTRGKKKGEEGYSWPDFRNRWCTSILKQNVIKQYFQGQTNIVEYHGISVDEKERADKNKDRDIKHPLIDWGMTGEDNVAYCKSLGFNWGGLYDKLERVSCYLCPLQRISELRVIYTEYPKLWEKMLYLDKETIKKHGRQFRSDYSIADLTEKFRKEKWVEDNQINMF